MTTKMTQLQMNKSGTPQLKKRLRPTPSEETFPRPVLRFSPYAWAKLQWFCHHGDTEIGGFGITAEDDLLLIQDFVTVRQRVSSVSVSFDDEAVADFFEDQVDAGRRPEQFGRLWLHTHPGDSADPSCTDEETFTRVFRGCDWAVMFILARGGATYARLRFNVGPRGQDVIPVQIDYSVPFAASHEQSWLEEYNGNIEPERPHPLLTRTGGNAGFDDHDPWGILDSDDANVCPDAPYDDVPYYEEVDGFDQILIDELR